MRVRQLGDPILRKVSQPVKSQDISKEFIQQSIAEMKSILDGLKAISDGNGNAIAAPQVGHAVRMIVLRLNDQFVVMINPHFTHVSEDTFDCEEECFSFYHLRGTVKRHSQVTVEYLDEQGHLHSTILSGEEAGLAQHEVDHLDGILFIDKISDKNQVASIDYVLNGMTQRFHQVRKMIDYMVG